MHWPFLLLWRVPQSLLLKNSSTAWAATSTLYFWDATLQVMSRAGFLQTWCLELRFIRPDQAVFTSQNSSKQIYVWILMWETTGDALFHWRKRYYGLWFEVKNILMLDLFQLLSSQDVNWWTGVVWIIVMFLSAVWTLILTAPIHCRASIAETLMQRCIYTNLFSPNFNLWVNYSFRHRCMEVYIHHGIKI